MSAVDVFSHFRITVLGCLLAKQLNQTSSTKQKEGSYA